MITTSIPDMEIWTSSNTEEMSTVFVYAGLASIVGPLLIGRLFDRVNDMLLLAFCFLFQAVSIALVPIWQVLLAFQAMTALNFVFSSAEHSGE